MTKALPEHGITCSYATVLQPWPSPFLPSQPISTKQSACLCQCWLLNKVFCLPSPPVRLAVAGCGGNDVAQVVWKGHSHSAAYEDQPVVSPEWYQGDVENRLLVLLVKFVCNPRNDRIRSIHHIKKSTTITNNCYNDRKNTQNNNNDRDDNNHQFHVNSWPRQFTASRHRHNQRKGLHSGEWVDRPSKASYCIQVLQLKSLECRYLWLEIFPFKDIFCWIIFIYI